MKKIIFTVSMCIIFTLIIHILYISPAQATTYYVQTIGDNGNSGRSWGAGNSWETFNYAVSQISPGDTLLIGTGTYYKSYWRIPQNFGSDGYQTIIACSSYGESAWGDKISGIQLADLCGGEVITGSWTQHESSNIYKRAFTTTAPGATGIDGYGTHNVWCVSQIGGAVDTMLICNMDYPDDTIPTDNPYQISEAGQFVHDYINDSLFAWCFGDDSPENYTIIGSCHPVIELRYTGIKNIRFWGLSMNHGTKGIVNWNNSGITDSLWFEYCFFDRAGWILGANSGLIASGSLNPPYLYQNTWFNNCTFGLCVQGQDNGWSTDQCLGAASNQYGVGNCTYDSCNVIGPVMKGFFFKKNDNCEDHLGYYNTVKNSIIRISPDLAYTDAHGIIMMNTPNYDSIYGNIIIGGANALYLSHNACEASVTGAPTYSKWGYFIKNNTFYDQQISFINIQVPGGWTSTEQNVIKNNIGFITHDSTGPFDVGFLEGNTAIASYFDIDYNIWNDGLERNLIPRVPNSGTGTNTDWSTWQETYGYDVHGDTSYDVIGFVDPDNEDFSRPNASGEISDEYAGRVWTIIGAVQPDSSFSISGIDTTTTSITIQFTYVGYTADTIILFYDTDGSIAGADSVYDITALDSPDSLQVTGLTANTGYDFWGVICYGGTNKDTTAILEIMTDTEEGNNLQQRRRRNLLRKLGGL